MRVKYQRRDGSWTDWYDDNKSSVIKDENILAIQTEKLMTVEDTIKYLQKLNKESKKK